MLGLWPVSAAPISSLLIQPTVAQTVYGFTSGLQDAAKSRDIFDPRYYIHRHARFAVPITPSLVLGALKAPEQDMGPDPMRNFELAYQSFRSQKFALQTGVASTAQTMPASLRRDDPWAAPPLKPESTAWPQFGWNRTPSLSWPATLTPQPRSQNPWPAPTLEMGLVINKAPRFAIPVGVEILAGIRPSSDLVKERPGLDVRLVWGQNGWARNPSIAWPANLQPWPKSFMADPASVLDVRQVGQPSRDWIFKALAPAVTTVQLAGTFRALQDAYPGTVYYTILLQNRSQRFAVPTTVAVFAPTIQSHQDAWDVVPDNDLRRIAGGLFGVDMGPELLAGLFVNREAVGPDPARFFGPAFLPMRQARFAIPAAPATPAQLTPAMLRRPDAWAAFLLQVMQIDRGQPGWIRNPSLSWPSFLGGGIRAGGPTVPFEAVLDSRSVIGQNPGWISSFVSTLPPPGTGNTYVNWHHHFHSHA